MEIINVDINNEKQKRRLYGEHLTSNKIFEHFIFPFIKEHIYSYIWVDLFCGEGNLILPILNEVPYGERVMFFKDHIFLFDIQEKMVRRAIEKAKEYGIPEHIAEKNIKLLDTLLNYPSFLLKKKLPVFHITNPPYLYLGYIVKNKEAQVHLKYFRKENEGYQDLYQIALINDLRNKISKMIYIIPSNFLFGNSISNKIRKDFFKYYTIEKAFIFEKKIFDFTGTNVSICFFRKKEQVKENVIEFEGTKINNMVRKRVYILHPKNKYRAGSEFDEFVLSYKAKKTLVFSFYLLIDDIKKNKGTEKIEVIDANTYKGNQYKKIKIEVSKDLKERIIKNILFVRTVDTGSEDGRVGLWEIKKVYGVDGILVTKAKYRTHPIQLFFEKGFNISLQLILKDYFNNIIEFFREKTDSEFMTTYKYSDSGYTRKYLGLSQVKAVIETFPAHIIGTHDFKELETIIREGSPEKLIDLIKLINKKRLFFSNEE